MKLDNITPYIAVGLACSALTFGVCYFTLGGSSGADNQAGEAVGIIAEIEDFLEENNYPFKEGERVSGAVNGYFSEITDEFTFYKPYENVSDIEIVKRYVNNSGTADVSGFQVDVSDDGNILITEVTEGLAAERQGIKAGDVITHIDGVSISEKGFENYANKLLGRQDTEVKLTIRRNDEVFDIDFIRDSEVQSTITWKKIDDIAYIKIVRFEMFSGNRMDETLKEIGESEKYIIDLRNNPGGLIEYATKAADYFVDEAEVRLNHYSGEVEKYSTENGRIDAEVVLLVNENSASSAEIFTALLRQYGKDVTIVGTQTYGKGIFQGEKTLSNGGILHYTNGYFTVGDGECWQGKGIAPDIMVEMDKECIDTDNDIQLKKAIEILEKY